jgi:Ni,Fe-hydrogenase maturation factor
VRNVTPKELEESGMTITQLKDSAISNLAKAVKSQQITTVLYKTNDSIPFGSEPIHVHAEKGDMECKFWLLLEEVEIREAFSYNLTPSAKKEVKKIIYQHFDLIVESWNNHFNN